ncbi:MAG: glycosyltransferase family 2 protein [Chthoniobacterales bacterium]
MPATDALISIVIPLWNEEAVVPELVGRLDATRTAAQLNFEIVCVNDGSADQTEASLGALLPKFQHWKLVKLSRNFGQQSAFRAGLDHATGSAIVLLDADLQDPPEVIPEMVASWQQGAKLVVGCRHTRAETGVRRICFDLFHRAFHRITGGIMPKNSGTFGLMDRTIADHLRAMPEQNLFLPALRSWVGYQQAIVWYDRTNRSGQPKQKFSSLLSYAWDGVTSFSAVPLKLISLFGILLSLIGFGYAGILLLIKLAQLAGYFTRLEVPGFTTVAVAVFCIGGIQLICTGIIGEYVARVYKEVKHRPHYIVENVRSSPPDGI